MTSRARRWGWPLAIVVLVLLPLIVSGSYGRHILVLSGIFALLALSLNLILGYLGELSFGHAAFFGIGAYTSALLALHLGVPFWGGLVAAAVAAGVAGLAIGYLTLNVKGPQFAIVTLGFGAILHLIANNWISLTRGPMGLTKIPPPPAIAVPFLGEVAFEREVSYYYLVLGLVLVALYVIHSLVESRTGRAFVAIRENDALAASIGVDVFRYKLLGFALATALAGVGGSMYAHYLRFIAPDVFGLYYVAAMVIMVIVGGKGTLVGPIIGAFMFVWLLEVLRVAGALRLVLFGALLTVCIVFVPGGLVSLWRAWVLGVPGPGRERVAESVASPVRDTGLR